ncbi:MAG: YdeI/OmpD-associated family protein [Ferruginibacter sp.]
MAIQTVLEKLQIKDEKNILVQGLPSSIEKQFIKLSFAKSVTPLLKTRRIDLALVFAISKLQLTDILRDILPAMQDEAKLWIAYPKPTSKIASDLCRDCEWHIMTSMGFETVMLVALDNTWSAMNFKKQANVVQKKPFTVTTTQVRVVASPKTHSVSIPDELKIVFRKNKNASEFFDSLPLVNKKEYVEWVAEAKKQETRTKRLESVLEKLNTGKKTPTAK